LPWLILLVCPLMHVFMHRGHHRHTPPAHPGSAQERPDPVEPGASR
jgi:hypothetical protein